MNNAETPAVATRALVKSFGNNRVLRGLDLSVAPGTILAVFGATGAGKTTLIKILASVMRPTSGRGLIDGLDLKEQPDEARAALADIERYMLIQRVARLGGVTHRVRAVEAEAAARLVQRAGFVPEAVDALARLAREVMPRGLAVLAAEVVAHRRSVAQKREAVFRQPHQEVDRLEREAVFAPDKREIAFAFR